MADANRPKVITWFRVYCGILTACYILMIPLGMVYLVIDPAELQMDPLEARIIGFLFIGMAIPLAVASALPFFLKPKPWVWIYNLVIICFGMTSCCFWPLCIPLLIFWIKPDTRVCFGRSG